MTSKLKCPFCNKNLILSYITDDLCCEECWESATEKVWQALIQAKQDLKHAEDMIVDLNTTLGRTSAKYAQSQKSVEIARKALEYYADSRFGKKQDDGTYVLKIDKGCGVTVVYTYDPRSAKQALEQIEQRGEQ